jgi:hypothetical protein
MKLNRLIIKPLQEIHTKEGKTNLMTQEYSRILTDLRCHLLKLNQTTFDPTCQVPAFKSF